MTEDIPPLRRENPDLEVAGLKRLMLALVALGATGFVGAMFYLFVVMK
jgi:hypothetical protein